jgi:hypothetical protein
MRILFKQHAFKTGQSDISEDILPTGSRINTDDDAISRGV